MEETVSECARRQRSQNMGESCRSNGGFFKKYSVKGLPLGIPESKKPGSQISEYGLHKILSRSESEGRWRKFGVAFVADDNLKRLVKI